MSPRQVRKFCKLDAAGETILKQAMTELGLSARAHDKVLRVARTIAAAVAITCAVPVGRPAPLAAALSPFRDRDCPTVTGVSERRQASNDTRHGTTSC